MPTPVASMTRRAASLTSGPTPSPGINVIVCRAMLLLSSNVLEPGSLTNCATTQLCVFKLAVEGVT
jgi:hypothetical protein